MMRNRRMRHTIWFLLMAYFLLPAPLQAGVPTEQVRGTVDKVLSILQDPRLKSDDKREERRSQLREIISPRFDFAEMAKRSLGAQWQQLSPDKQQEFVKLFTDLLEKSYVDRIDSYNGEKILYTGEKLDQDSAEVDTKIATKKGEEFAINYKLHSTGGQWKVDDVVIENISLVNNYRSQFNRVIASASFDELLRRLREKQFDAPERNKKSEKS